MQIRSLSPVAALAALCAGAISAGVARTVDASGAVVVSTAQNQQQQQAGARILVGPNVHVSRETSGPFNETHLAAHPTDPNVLMGSAIDMEPLGDTRRKIWITSDRGLTWRATYLPEIGYDKRRGVPDPMLYFGATGTMFVKFTDRPVQRSDDGGKTWTTAKRTWTDSDDWQGDRETMGADWSGGKYHGRIYHLNGGGDGVYGQATMLRSSDDGRTFDAVKGTVGGWGLYPLVFSDGGLAVASSLPGGRGTRYAMNVSSDGGDTFQLGAPIPAWTFSCGGLGNMQVLPGRFHKPVAGAAAVGQQFAVDNSRSSPYRDRLYVVQPDCREGVWRLRLFHSTDRGKSWSDPVWVSLDVPSHTRQFVAALAVNRDGVLAVLWHDTRHSRADESYDVYMTASLDGGATFLPAVRVSSEASAFDSDRVVIVPYAHSDSLLAVSRRAANEDRSVGDYVGLAADAGGVFHSFWSDSRSGTYHVYSAQVRVVKAGTSASRCDAGSGGTSGSTRALNGVLRPEWDPVVDDSTARATRLPLRLRNVSRDTVCGPFRMVMTPITADTTAKRAPIELTFGVGGALRNLHYLAPGGTTEPLSVAADFRGAPRYRWSYTLAGPAMVRR
jgi:hypothetical protein